MHVYSLVNNRDLNMQLHTPLLNNPFSPSLFFRRQKAFMIILMIKNNFKQNLIRKKELLFNRKHEVIVW